MHIDFPAGRIFAKANNIIRVIQENETEGHPTLTIAGMQFKRSFPFTSDDNGVVVFPLDGILEALIGDNLYYSIPNNEVSISYLRDGEETTIQNDEPILVVNGASDKPFAEMTGAGIELGFPQPKKIQINSNLLPVSVPVCLNSNVGYLCVVGVHRTFFDGAQLNEWIETLAGSTDYSTKYVYLTDTDEYVAILYTTEWVRYSIPSNPNAIIYYALANGNNAIFTSAMKYSLDDNSVNRLVFRVNLEDDGEFHPASYVIDDCTEGYIIKWIDIYGYTMYFRFTQKDKSDIVKTEKTISYFNNDLKEQKKRVKTWVQSLALTSGLVDSDTFDWLKRIPLGRNIQIYDPETGNWNDCYCEDVTMSGQNEMNAVNVVISTEKLTPNI